MTFIHVGEKRIHAVNVALPFLVETFTPVHVTITRAVAFAAAVVAGRCAVDSLALCVVIVLAVMAGINSHKFTSTNTETAQSIYGTRVFQTQTW